MIVKCVYRARHFPERGAVMKLLAGRVREVRAGMWVLAGLSLLFFIVSPR